VIPLPLNIKAIAIGVVLITTFVAGWKTNGWRHDVALNKGLQDMLEMQEVHDKKARELVAKFQTKQARQVIIYRNLKSEVKDVTDNRVCFADNAALGLWNNALTGFMPEATPRAIETPTSTNTVTDEQVLNNAVENFEQAKQIRDQLDALIDWHEAN
jgi:hypothetical protein